MAPATLAPQYVPAEFGKWSQAIQKLDVRVFVSELERSKPLNLPNLPNLLNP